MLASSQLHDSSPFYTACPCPGRQDKRPLVVLLNDGPRKRPGNVVRAGRARVYLDDSRIGTEAGVEQRKTLVRGGKAPVVSLAVDFGQPEVITVPANAIPVSC